MDLIKKRKADESGGVANLNNTAPSGILYPEDAEKILQPFTKEQLLPIVRAAVLRHPDVLEAVRAVADADPVQRKLFVRGLGWETTTDKLRQVFSVYGELDEANTIVITDKNTGKSKGYGFVTFKHIDAAMLSLKEQNKKIDGRMTVTQLAVAGSSGNSHSADVALRKIYVGNIPFEISSERLLSYFSLYGEIEEGPLGFDKQSGKTRGFAFFVYKTEDGAKGALADPTKTIDGNQVVCKLAADNKKHKSNVGYPGGMAGLGMANAAPPNYGNYGMGGYMGYAPVLNGPLPPPQQSGMVHQNAGYINPVGAPGFGGPYGSAGLQFGGTAAAPREFGGAGGYRMPSSTVGSAGYPDSGNYGLQSAYPSQQNQPASGSGIRLPAYQGMPPYY